MAFQLSDIRTKVRQRVRDTSYSAGEIDNYINDTQNDVFNEYDLKFMEASQNYTLAVDTQDITNGSGLPSNFVRAINVENTTSGDEQRLVYTPYRVMQEMYPDSTDNSTYPSNPPTRWYEYGETINVFPKPDKAYTVTLYYHKKPTLLSADSDVPEIPSEFEEMLVSGAAYRVLQVKDNYDQASIHQNKFDELLQKLVKRYSNRQTGQANRIRINRRAMGKSHF